MLPDSYKLITTITRSLMEAEKRRLAGVKAQLVKTALERYGAHKDGFAYAGQVFDREGLPKGPRQRVSLDYALYAEADDYLADMAQIDTDTRLISQILVPLLDTCTNLQEVRDALPECLVDTLPELQKFSRRMPAAWTLQGPTNDRLRRQYEKILPRIAFYSAARLMY